MEHNLALISSTLIAQQAENEAFRDFIEYVDEKELDSLVMRLNNRVQAKIDCTKCGNCCKTIMINFEEKETEQVAGMLNITKEEFINKYVERGLGNNLIMKSMPCSFLENNMCTVYAQRFEGCRDFPYLHIPGFKKRLAQFYLHIEVCPIAFNVLQLLKSETGFKYLTV